MVKDMQSETPLLSKWWRTKSAKAAMKRAITKKKEKHAKWLKGLKEYKARQHQEIWGA